MPETQELTIQYVDVRLLDPNPWNPNVQDEQTAKAERESIETYGFIDPVTVRVQPADAARFEIIDGEHRLIEAKALGHTVAPIVVLDVDDDQARKLTIILNETRGDHDLALLGQLLADLSTRSTVDDLLVGLPYTADDLARFVEIGRVDGWDSDLDPDAMDGKGDAPAELPSFVVEFKTERDAKQFGKLVATLCREWETTESVAVVRAVKAAAASR